MEKIKWLIDLLKGGIEVEIYVVNLNELNCSNIRTLCKSNTNQNICKSHYNCGRICAGKNAILFRNFEMIVLNKENSVPNISKH